MIAQHHTMRNLILSFFTCCTVMACNAVRPTGGQHPRRARLLKDIPPPLVISRGTPFAL